MSSQQHFLVSVQYGYVPCTSRDLFELKPWTQNAFTEEVVKLMASLNTRPIILPLSNPVSLCEVNYEDAIDWLVLSASICVLNHC